MIRYFVARIQIFVYCIFLGVSHFPVISGGDKTTPYQSLLTLQNGSEVTLPCPPAEQFTRMHMAPDFESPQLIRRLDWFHDDFLVASYQQNVVEDASRQWWVADRRFELLRPFYHLRLQPLRPEDSGEYRCRLETDPLFALTMNTATVNVRVMVRPVPPSSPEIRGTSNRSVTLAWTHSTGAAHRPILRYSVVVRSLADGARFVIPAPSNATSVIVDNLSPFTEYAFSVRAENAAGNSDFGPESIYRTKGEAPSTPPTIVSMSNTSSQCVSLVVTAPTTTHGELVGFRAIIRRTDGTTIKETFLSPIPTNTYALCDLHPHSVYQLNVAAETEFGVSPEAEKEFRTDQSVPGSPPQDVGVEGVVGHSSLFVHWKPPKSMNGVLTAYNIYHKANGHSKWKVDSLKIKPSGHKDSYRVEIKGLEPASRYSVRVSASTIKGEGQRSNDVHASTDHTAPPPSEIANITFDCRQSVLIEWKQNKVEGINYRLRLDNGGNLVEMNTTKLSMELKGLAHQNEYIVKVGTVIRSVVDNKTWIEGEWSTPQRFLLDENCALHSSVCGPSHANCMKLTQVSGPPRIGSFLIFSAIFLFVLVCAIAFYMLRGFHRCYDVKKLLKKREKSVYLEELSPLVYDSIGCEDIPVELFYGYCEDLARNDAHKYKAQFEQVERLTAENSSDKESLERNMEKNRYLNIGALESTRIRINSPSGSDYINANYIDSCEKRNAYIATQAPLPSTFIDFFHLLWQERCNVIVMITNLVEDGRRKCDQYWPSSTSAPQLHGIYQVSLVSQTVNAFFIHRILSLRIAKCVPPAERRIHQLHFTGWPDHGVPPTVFPLLSFINTVADIHSTGPIVVHCSAGVGRSGSYILIDSMRRHLLSFRSLNMMGHLVHIRKQREKLVQTVEQYIFCHETVRQLIRHGITRVHSELFHRYIKYLAEENVNGKTRIQMQYEDICKCLHQPQCGPVAEYLVLPGYHRIDEFVIVSWPEEREDLWTLVWERNIQTIVLLGGSPEYWSKIGRVGEITIQHGDQFVMLQNKDDQLCVRLIDVNPTVLESQTWTEIERIQTERLAYHESPLLVISPIKRVESPTLITSAGILPSTSGTLPNGNGTMVTGNGTQSGTETVIPVISLRNGVVNGIPTSPTQISDPRAEKLSPKKVISIKENGRGSIRTRKNTAAEPHNCGNPAERGYVLCALTALACQLEQQGCIDVVQVLSSYTNAHCGLWNSRHEVEFIYDRMLQLVHLSKV